jgi:hypothetical protein
MNAFEPGDRLGAVAVWVGALAANRGFWLAGLGGSLIIAAAVFAVELGFWPRSPHVFAELNEAGGRFLIAGWSDMPLGWRMSFYGRKREDLPWVGYYLDHESDFWRDVTLVHGVGNHLLVKRAGMLMGDLDLSVYSFKNYHNNFTYRTPVKIVLGDPLGEIQPEEVSPESPGWGSLLPRAVLGAPQFPGIKSDRDQHSEPAAKQ